MSADAAQRWLPRLRGQAGRLSEPPPVIVEGKLTRMVGLTLEAVGCEAAIGDRCVVLNRNGERVDTEVVGFAGESLFLMPTGHTRGLAPNARVIPCGGSGEIPVGPGLLGRVIDGLRVVLEGVQAGDKVVVNGLQRARPNIAVKASEVAMDAGIAAAERLPVLDPPKPKR